MKAWKTQIKGLRKFIDNPSPIDRYKAQWYVESLEEMLEEMEEDERRELEEIDRWSEQREADFLTCETHAHAQGMCD